MGDDKFKHKRIDQIRSYMPPAKVVPVLVNAPAFASYTPFNAQDAMEMDRDDIQQYSGWKNVPLCAKTASVNKKKWLSRMNPVPGAKIHKKKEGEGEEDKRMGPSISGRTRVQSQREKIWDMRKSMGYLDTGAPGAADDVPVKPFVQLMKKMIKVTVDEQHDWYPFPKLTCADWTTLILGKRRTGKTTLLKNLLPHTGKQFPEVYVMTQTAFTHSFKNYVPKEAIYPGWFEGVIMEFLDEQKELIEKLARLVERYRETEDPSYMTAFPNPFKKIILDDCVVDPKVHSSLAMGTIAAYGRHYGLNVDVISQHATLLNPNFRTNSDNVFTFLQDEENNIETIRKSYMDFKNINEFRYFLSTRTRNKQFLCVDRSDNDRPWYENIYHGKSDPKVKPVLLGDPRWRRKMKKQEMEAGDTSGPDPFMAPIVQTYAPPSPVPNTNKRKRNEFSAYY